MACSPAFPCPHCGVRSFRRHPVDAERRALAHLSLCTACGENYLAVVHVDAGRGRVETWDYFLDREPVLRRVRGYEQRGRFGEVVRVASLFFIGDDAVSERSWQTELVLRRAMPSRIVAVEGEPMWMLAGLIKRCRAWWSRQSMLGRVPLGRVPTAQMMFHSTPDDGSRRGRAS